MDLDSLYSLFYEGFSILKYFKYCWGSIFAENFDVR